MASIWASIRGIPSILSRKPKETIQTKGNLFEVAKYGEFGFMDTPTCIAYDANLGFLVIGNKKGTLKVLGRPGLECVAQNDKEDAIIKVQFIPNTGLVVTADVAGTLELWRIECSSSSSPASVASLRLHKLAECIQASSRAAVTSKPAARSRPGQDTITALCCSSDGRCVLYGTEAGHLGILQMNAEVNDWTWPSADSGAYPASRLMDRLSRWKLQHVISAQYFTSLIHIEEMCRVVEEEEEDGSMNGTFLLAYSSGLMLVLDVAHDRILHVFLSSGLTQPVVTLPCAESTPVPSARNGNAAAAGHTDIVRMSCVSTVMKYNRQQQKQRTSGENSDLVTAYEDGSLQQWSLTAAIQERLEGRADEVSTPKKVSYRPYGPFQCTGIGKVLCADLEGSRITIFSGGLTRALTSSHHTVTIMEQQHQSVSSLHSSNLTNTTGAGDSSGIGSFNGSFLQQPTVMNSRERHVCLDLSSPLIDMVLVRSRGGHMPGQGTAPTLVLLLLLREELAAVDLSHPEWRPLPVPYLSCLHLSTITNSLLLPQVDATLLHNLEECWWHQVTQTQVPQSISSLTYSQTSRQVAPEKSDYWFSHHPLRHGCDVFPMQLWPVQGDAGSLMSSGRTNSDNIQKIQTTTEPQQLLLTGHEDGTVHLWRVKPFNGLTRIFSLRTGRLFADGVNMSEEEAAPYIPFSSSWPPFRPLGLFDPLTDDPILAVRTIHFLPPNAESDSPALLLVGGATGQLSLWGLPTQPASVVFSEPMRQKYPLRVPVRLQVTLEGSQKIPWKGFNAPEPAQDHLLLENMRQANGGGGGVVQPLAVVQLSPPASIKCLTCERLDSVLFIGIATLPGFCVLRVDLAKLLYSSNEPSISSSSSVSSPLLLVLNRGTLSPGALTPFSTSSAAGAAAAEEQAALAGDGWGVRRSKVIKNSLRESFRNLRRRTSKRQMTMKKENEGLQEIADDADDEGGFQEREIIGKRVPAESPTEASTNSLLLHLQSEKNSSRVLRLYVGTLGGRVRIFNLPLENSTRPVSRPEKELHLNHHAPITYLNITTASGTTKTTRRGSSAGVHEVAHVISEEQLRIYSLPKWSLKAKYRLTATEGYRVQNAVLLPATAWPEPIPSSARRYLLVNTDKGQWMAFHGDNLSRLECIQYLPAGSKIVISSVLFSNLAPTVWFTSASGQLSVMQLSPTPGNTNQTSAGRTSIPSHRHPPPPPPPTQWEFAHPHSFTAGDYTLQGDVSLTSLGDTVHKFNDSDNVK